jgi:uncharacterized membrane protein
LVREPDLAELWGARGALESTPPLYYALQKVWLVFGDTPAAMRSLAAVFGVLTILPLFAIGWTPPKTRF